MLRDASRLPVKTASSCARGCPRGTGRVLLLAAELRQAASPGRRHVSGRPHARRRALLDDVFMSRPHCALAPFVPARSMHEGGVCIFTCRVYHRPPRTRAPTKIDRIPSLKYVPIIEICTPLRYAKPARPSMKYTPIIEVCKARASMPHAGTPRQPHVVPRNSNPQRGDWSRVLTSQDDPRMASSGCHAPGPHAISTRTAHTTTTSSIHRSLRPWDGYPAAPSPPRLPPDGASTSLPVYQNTRLCIPVRRANPIICPGSHRSPGRDRCWHTFSAGRS